MSFFGDIAKGIAEGALGPLFSWLNKKEDKEIEKFKVNGQVDQSLISAHVANLQARKELRLANEKTASGRMMQYLFVYPLGIWFAAIIFYCIAQPYFPGIILPVLDLPPLLKEWGGYIVGFLFLVSKIDGWVRRT